MIVDFHTHIFPPQIAGAREKWLAADPLFAAMYRDPRAKIATADQLLASMDRSGIDVSVVLGFAWVDAATCKQHNDYLLGPVTFTLNFAGTAPTSITSALFRFGTNSADTQTGSCCGGTTSSVPEPTSIALLGGVVALAASKLKKRVV